MHPPRPHPATPGAWIVGALVGVAIAWRMPGDLLLNVDQIVGPEIPWPRGMFLDGPELPRRTPFWIPLAALSRVVAGPVVVAALVVAASAALGAGAGRWAPRTPGAPEAVAALAAVSPFVTTRLVVGHLPLVVATVLVVWFGHRLVWPGRGRWWILLAFGLTGSSGAVVGLALFTIGWVAPGEDRSPLDRLRELVVMVLTQTPWLVPGVVVASKVGLDGGGGRAFVTELDGVWGLPRLLAGGGFFLRSEDLSRSAPLSAALGLTLLGLVVFDAARRGADRRHVTALIGVVAAVSTALPLLGPTLVDASGWGPLGILREPQKFITLWLVAGLWCLARHDVTAPAPVAPVGRDGRRTVTAAVVGGVVAVSLGWPAAFGADGRLAARDLPSWELVDEAVGDDAVVLALPWERYGSYDITTWRQSLGPVPWLFDAEVRASGDAGLGRGSVERETPDATAHEILGRDHRLGRPIGAQARALGIDVVVVFSDRRNGADELLGDADLEPIVVEDTYAAFRVRPAG